MSLLVAVDFSDALDRQLQIVSRLARPGREIHLLHVAEPNPSFVGLEAGPDEVRHQVAVEFKREHEQLQSLAERLRGEGYEILMPRRASDDPAALVERFARAGGGMVLLGARAFWQGLDIPGTALQAVVIEKLPFEVPTELRKRREARLRTAGENAFERYTMGKMLLNLKQMSGRLIRSEEDRGLIAIVEGRTDRPYFRRLREAFPAEVPVNVARREDLPDLLAEVGIQLAQRATLRSRDREDVDAR